MADVQQQEVQRVLHLAQTVLEEGRHRETIAACQHVLGHFPDAITALRLLGEALLEAGRPEEASRTFEKVLTAEPYNVLARVGLGVIAEDRGEDERAIAQFRLAWEVEPMLPQLRGELVRLYRKRYGMGGRLRMTRIALANLHAHNDQLLRAIRQFALLHEEEPQRLDVTLGWAVALWRHGDDADTVRVCQLALAERPRLVRALLILAAISGDGGAVAARVGKSAPDLLTMAHELDPDRALARHLVAFRDSPTLDAFIKQSAPIPAFDATVVPLAGTDELLTQHLLDEDTRQTTWDDLADSWATRAAENGTPPQAAQPGGYLDDDVDALFAAIDRQLSHGADSAPGAVADSGTIEPLALDDLGSFGEAAAPVAAEEPRAAWDAPEDDLMMPTPDEPTAVERLTANWDNIDNELAAARPTEDASLTTGMLSAAGIDFQPFDVDEAVDPEAETGIVFDPAKFSLPPLDDDDEDEELAEELAADGLDLDITPLSLDDVGGKPKTSGITFADIVERDRGAEPHARTDTLGDRPAVDTSPITDAASIFATRELSSLPEDRLLELGIAGTETLAQFEPFQVPFAEPAADPGAPTVQANGDAGHAAPSPSAAVDALLSAETPRLVLPESNYPADGTRPLLSDEAISFGLPIPQANQGTAAFGSAGQAPDGADQLFSRLRQRRHERVQSSDLLDPQARQVTTGSNILPSRQAEDPNLYEDVVVAEGVKPDAATAPQAQGDAADDWLTAITMSAPEPQAPAAPSLPPPEAAAAQADAESAELGETGWLASLVDATTPDDAEPLEKAQLMATDDDMPAWLATVPEAREDAESVAAPDDDAVALGQEAVSWEAGTLPYSTAEDVQLDHVVESPGHRWATADTDRAAMPEQPAPIWASPAATQQPTWGDEVPDTVVTPPSTPAWSRDEVPAPAAPLVAEAAVPVTPVEVAPAMPTPVAPTPVSPAAALPVVRVEVVHEVVVPAPVAPPPVVAARPAVAPPAPVVSLDNQIASLEAMVAADPQNHFARLTLAVAYSSERPEQALTEYRRLIKMADDLIPEVIERLREMIADGDAPSRTHRVLGDAYMKLGQYDMAMAEFQRAIVVQQAR